MKTRSIKNTLLCVLFAVLLLCAFGFFIGSDGRVAKAEVDADAFRFETGAYVKISGDGGLRFRLQMGENKRNEVLSGGDLTFYVGPKTFIDAYDEETNTYEDMVDANKAWKVVANKDYIYAGSDMYGEPDGYYYSNVLLDINVLPEVYRDINFVAVAVFGETVVSSVDRTLYYTASKAALNGYFGKVMNTYSWVGSTPKYALVATNAVEYNNLSAGLAGYSTKYFELDNVEDTSGILDTYDTGYEYALEFSTSTGAWNNQNLTTIIDLGSGYAGKTLAVSMMVCGTANAEGEEKLGFNVYRTFAIPREKLSSMTWSEVTGTCTLDENGQWNVGACCWGEPLEAYCIYVKDVTYEPYYTVHFATNGGDEISDVQIPADTSLVNFDASYKTSKSYALFDGWYTTSTFDAGTRVGTDITSIPVNGNYEFTVYAKWDNYTAFAQYYWPTGVNTGSYFGGQAVQIPLAGRETGDKVDVTMRVKTSLDGTEGASVRLYHSYADTEWIASNADADGYWGGAVLNPATESGWRQVKITVELKQDGYVWLAVASENPGLGRCYVYIKDVTFEPHYTVHFVTNGGNAVSDVVIPVDTSLVNFDATYSTSKSNAFFDGWYTTSTFDAGTRVGTDITSIPVNGNYEFTVYAKWDNYTATSHYYSNQGAWFGGQAAQIPLAGREIGNIVEITMKVKTSLDGTEGASVKLYQTYADTQWIGNVADGYWSGAALDPATESGWREITITVELKQNGYVWLAVANETPELGQCFVYIKDITFEYLYDYQFTYSGNWFSSGTATILTGQAANADLVLSMQVKTSIDGTTTTNPYIGSFESTTTSDGNFTNGGTLDVSATGWREIIVTVKANDSGDVLLGLGRYAEGSAFTVYIKDVTYVSDYQFTYSGNWFSSGTAKILTDQAADADLVLSMQVKTSIDGTTTTNPYIGSFESTTTSDGNFTNGGTLDVSATGWREIIVTVKANDSGDVLLGLGRYAEGSAFTVYIKDVTIVTN